MSVELTAPFVLKDEEQRIVYGPVLVPDEPDSDGDLVTAERIEKVAHSFVENYGNIDVQHSLNNVGRLVESYLLPMDLETDDGDVVPKGSWMMGVRVTDDDAWSSVKDGTLGGFSIMAMRSSATKSVGKANESKRVTLADLGDDWIVNAVSLVDQPAVPKAKWLAIKSAEKAVSGSWENIRNQLETAIRERFNRPDYFLMVHSTLADTVVFQVISEFSDDRQAYQIGYSVGEHDQVELTGDAEPVLVQESVVTLDNMLDSAKSIEDDQGRERLRDRILKGLGFGGKDESTGGDFAKMNLEQLHKARNAIDELVAAGGLEREDGEDTMKTADVEELISKAMSPITERLDAMAAAKAEEKPGDEGAAKDDGSEGESEEGAAKSEKDQDGEEVVEEVEKSAAERAEDFDDEAVEAILKRHAVPFSNRLSGQDGSVKEEERPTSDRDAFGFKR